MIGPASTRIPPARYDTIRYTIFMCAKKLTNSQLYSAARNQTKRATKKLKTKKNETLIRNGPIIKSVESVMRPEGSLWWERFVKEVGLEPGVKERGSYAW